MFLFLFRRGKSFTRRMRNGRLLCKISKVHVQILIAIFASILSNIPYYFQYDMIPCHQPIVENVTCKCPKTTFNEDGFHPIPWLQHYPTARISKHHNTIFTIDDQREFNNGDVVFWMHCRTEFSFSLLWNIWYIAYEVRIIHIIYPNMSKKKIQLLIV